jgi:uncharacterized membrane protein
MQPYENEQSRGEQLAVGLGWFSIGLGLAELAAPDAVARFIGLRDDATTTSVLRAYGGREIGNGLAILMQPDNPTWLWSRVGGDVLDLASLASAARGDYADQRRVAAASAAVLGVTALDMICAQQLSARQSGRQAAVRPQVEGVQVERVTTVSRPIEDVYQFWKNFENFPRFMRHLESVHITGDRRSRWCATGPAGMRVEWDAETIRDDENEWIAWRSLEGSDVQNSGSVRFTPAPGARGTEVRVQLQYSPPGGALGRSVAWLFGEEPDQQVHEDLHRFKQLIETGEIPLSEGPGLWRAAQPPADPEEVRRLAGVRR